MTPSTHGVKSLKKAKEWAARDVEESELPLQIHQNRCNACGRLSYIAANSKGEAIRRFN